MQFIVQQLMPKKEKHEQNLSRIFNVLDKFCDGGLTEEGILKGYTTTFGSTSNHKLTADMVKDLFSRATTGPDGTQTEFLSFSQFILAGVNHQKSILTNHYLNLAF